MACSAVDVMRVVLAMMTVAPAMMSAVHAILADLASNYRSSTSSRVVVLATMTVATTVVLATMSVVPVALAVDS